MHALQMYIAAQAAEAFTGTVTMWAMYRDHFDSTEGQDDGQGETRKVLHEAPTAASSARPA